MRFSWLYNLLFENVDDPIVGIVGVTNEDGVGYDVVRRSEIYGKAHSALIDNSKGSRSAILRAFKNKFNDSNVAWRYNVLEKTLYIWDLNLVDKDLVDTTKWYLEDKIKYPVTRIKKISSIDDDSFDRSHFRSN